MKQRGIKWKRETYFIKRNFRVRSVIKTKSLIFSKKSQCKLYFFTQLLPLDLKLKVAKFLETKRQRQLVKFKFDKIVGRIWYQFSIIAKQAFPRQRKFSERISCFSKRECENHALFSCRQKPQDTQKWPLKRNIFQPPFASAQHYSSAYKTPTFPSS